MMEVPRAREVLEHAAGAGGKPYVAIPARSSAEHRAAARHLRAASTELRRRGVDFLTIPDAYYQTVWNRVNKMLTEHGNQIVKEDHMRVKDLGILVDADDEGYLLQLFTKLLQDRPTLFFEIICRRGSQSFGKGNFKALFERLEIEWGRRGNL